MRTSRHRCSVRSLVPALAASVLLSLTILTQAVALEAEVRARIAVDGEAWVGQQIIVQVELLSDGLSFSGQRFRVPDIAGALLLEDAVSTIKLSEARGGETWQVLRYEFPLFAQRAGRIDIPPIGVEFSVSSGFGGETREFQLQTSPLNVEIGEPPGVTDPERLVTTSAFTLDVTVTPQATELKVGDAVTRTVTRTATDVSGMAFAPLPEPQAPGMAVYPKAPIVEDKQNRGELIGRRSDAVTFVFEQPGGIRLPALEMQWWDPVAGVLHTESVPELAVEVAANPAPEGSQARLTDTFDVVRYHPWVTAALVVLVAAAGVLAYRYHRRMRLASKRWRAACRAAEPARFRAFVRTCRRGQAAPAYRAFQGWQASRVTPDDPRDFDAGLRAELEHLQLAVVTREQAWDGSALAQAARCTRRAAQRQRHANVRRALPPLNPGGHGPYSVKP